MHATFEMKKKTYEMEKKDKKTHDLACKRTSCSVTGTTNSVPDGRRSTTRDAGEKELFRLGRRAVGSMVGSYKSAVMFAANGSAPAGSCSPPPPAKDTVVATEGLVTAAEATIAGVTASLQLSPKRSR